jgi:hypothetical protein
LIRGILCVSCDPAGMWPGVWHRLGARERGVADKVFDERSKRRRRIDKELAGDVIRLRRSRVHLQRVCHIAKAEHSTESGVSGTRSGAARGVPRYAVQPRGARASERRGAARRGTRKQAQRVATPTGERSGKDANGCGAPSLPSARVCSAPGTGASLSRPRRW